MHGNNEGIKTIEQYLIDKEAISKDSRIAENDVSRYSQYGEGGPMIEIIEREPRLYDFRVYESTSFEKIGLVNKSEFNYLVKLNEIKKDIDKVKEMKARKSDVIIHSGTPKEELESKFVYRTNNGFVKEVKSLAEKLG